MSVEAAISARDLELTLRPVCRVQLLADLVSADRCRRVRAGMVLVRFAGGAHRDEVRVWRTDRTPGDGLTCLLRELHAVADLETLATMTAPGLAALATARHTVQP